jgi:nucleotide-binding universal stress UspA family protein
VLVVKQPVAGMYRRVLVPVDFTAHSDACVQVAGRLAPRAELQMFHALASAEEFHLRMAGMPAETIRDRGDAEEGKRRNRMHGIAARAGIESNRLGTVVRRGPAWACTLAQADAYGADLIAVAKQGSSAMADFFLGSVTRRLLATAKCDVLVTPPVTVERPRAQPAAATAERLAMHAGSWPAREASADSRRH